MKMEGDRPVTADIDQWKVLMAGGLNKQFIEATNPSVIPIVHRQGPSSFKRPNMTRKRPEITWGSVMAFTKCWGFNSWNSGEKFHVDWLSWELDWWCHCVFYHDLSTIGKSPTSLRASGSRGRTSSYDMIWSELYIYIWLYDMIFPDYFFYFTSVSESGVDLCQLAFLGAIFVLKLGCRPKPWGFGLTIKKGSRWHGIFATVWWLIWLVILHKRTFSFECRDRYSISRRNSSVRHQFFQQVRCRWIHAGAISDPNQRDWGREVSFANSPGSPRLSSHGGWIGHRRILRIRFCFPPTALAPQPHGGTSETKVDSWHPLTTQDSWIMGIFWVSLNGFAEFQMQCGQLQDPKGHSVVA